MNTAAIGALLAASHVLTAIIAYAVSHANRLPAIAQDAQTVVVTATKLVDDVKKHDLATVAKDARDLAEALAALGIQVGPINPVTPVAK